MDVFTITYVKNTTVHKMKYQAKNTLFTKIKVKLEEKGNSYTYIKNYNQNNVW